jgi:Protein of unknown function (DUF3443)
MNRSPVRAFIALLSSALLLWSLGCSSASTSPSSTPPPTGTAPTGPNVASIAVNGGPATPDGYPYPNGAFTSVTICVPGSTTQCQTIGGILVDTGSYGLRIEASALTLSLPQQVDSGNNPIVECGEFDSGFTWGPVQTADFTISGETASSLPIQVMGSANYPDTDVDADACSDGEAGTSYDLNSVETLGANGILGVGNFAQDCGTACTQTGGSNPGTYYSCPDAASCGVTAEALSSQVVNPVAMFSTDNNGVIVELPAVSAPTTSVSGYLVFGIGTESNNGLGSATIYDVDTTYGNFTTVFGGVPYSDSAFLDSGSEVLFFLDPTVTGLPECTDVVLYCPTANINLSATNEGFSNGNSGPVSFTIGNGDTLISNSADNAINDIGAPGEYQNGSLYFDWGLPFFFGTNVYTAIDGATTPGGPGPYVAY